MGIAGNAGGGDIVVEQLLEGMVSGRLVLLAALLM
jgi:hypothetical protein